MKRKLTQLSRRYASALRTHLKQGRRASLQPARGLGHEAVSLGLETLVDVTEQLSSSGQSLKLCAANKTLREVLNLAGVGSLFEHFDDVNTAIRSFL